MRIYTAACLALSPEFSLMHIVAVIPSGMWFYQEEVRGYLPFSDFSSIFSQRVTFADIIYLR
jgi:hypothetical protein